MLFTPKYNGVTEDIRSDKEKIKDWDSRELTLGETTGKKITKLPGKLYDQQGTSACTAHSFLTMLEYNKVLAVDVSRFALYRKRFNYPGAGSNIIDLILKSHPKFGALGGLTKFFDISHPSTLTEAWANSVPFLLGSTLTDDFEYYTAKDYADLERTVNSGLAVSFGFYSTNAEWRREYVEERTVITNPFSAQVRHQATLIPGGAFRENGKLWFSVHDSAGFGGRFIRYVTLEFLKNRKINNPIFAIPTNTPTPEPPLIDAKPLVAVSLESRGPDVLNLQSYLAKRGFLEAKHVTGYYGPLTSKGVLWFQLHHYAKMKSTIPELLDLKGHWWGPQSIEAVKKIK